MSRSRQKSGTPEKMGQPKLILIGAGVLLSLGHGNVLAIN
jgi:hypothetical protein